MTEEQRWKKVEEIVRKVVSEEMDARGFKLKAKLSFSGGRWVGITEEQQEAWKLAYPSVNIQQQLQLAAAWIVSNPTLAPKSNYPRFLNTWLTRQQNQASLHAIPTARTIQHKTCDYCEKPSSGFTNGHNACDEHFAKAMYGERPPKLKLA